MPFEEITFFGNENILAKHKTTFEITKENFLTKRGDCIIGINSNKSVFDLSNDLKRYLLSGGKIRIEIIVEDFRDEIIAYGSKELILTSKKSLVIRKSSYIDDRTLAINSNKAAIDIKREIINELKKGKFGKLIIYYGI